MEFILVMVMLVTLLVNGEKISQITTTLFTILYVDGKWCQ